MTNIIKSDLFRIFKGKAIYITIMVMMVFTIICVVTLEAGTTIGLNNNDTSKYNNELAQQLANAKSLGEYRKIMKEQGSFELDKGILAQSMNLYYIFIVLGSIVICIDFSNSSIKNTLSSAVSRKKYYFSKLAVMLGLATFMIILNNCGIYILNYFINGREFSSNLLDLTKITLYQLPIIYGIVSLLTGIAFFVRSKVTYNTITIPFIMVLQLVVIVTANILKISIDWFYNYEAQFALRKLADNPSTTFILQCLALGIIYIVVFNFIGYKSFAKAEIK